MREKERGRERKLKLLLNGAKGKSFWLPKLPGTALFQGNLLAIFVTQRSIFFSDFAMKLLYVQKID